MEAGDVWIGLLTKDERNSLSRNMDKSCGPFLSDNLPCHQDVVTFQGFPSSKITMQEDYEI